MSTIGQFSDWLAGTPPSLLIQSVAWIVPATQTVHILALSMVFFAMVVFNLQVMGLLSRPASLGWTRQPLFWLWSGLAVLAVSGIVLVVGEPRRELMSWPFRIKMLLIVVAALLTLFLARLAERDPTLVTRVTAGFVLACWTLIIILGRWIAYINFGEEESY